MQALPPFDEWGELSLEDARALAADPHAPPQKKLEACTELVVLGRTAEATPGLLELERLPEFTSRARRMQSAARFVERLAEQAAFSAPRRPGEPYWDTVDGSRPGAVAGPSGVLLWLRPGAAKTVLAFSTYRGGFGPMRGWTSVALLHRYLSHHDLNIVYLRDETRRLNLAGNASLGADYPACLAGLRRLCEARGWRDVYALGLSAGGYPALRYGLDLGVRAVLSLSGPTRFEPGAAATLYRALHEAAPHMAVDLLPLYRAAGRRPRLLLCYGERNAEDSAMAVRMAELPEAELVPFPGFAGHSTFVAALLTRRFDLLVERLVGAKP